MSDRIAEPSSWKTPIVSVALIISNVFSSSRGTLSMSINPPPEPSINSSVRSMMASVLRPRKSIFNSPRSAIPCISY